MSCVEHYCVDCDFIQMDNNSIMEKCPKCGGEVLSSYDEELWIDDEYED